MFSFRLGFEHPYYLVLLILLPLVWWVGYRSLAGLGPWRRWLALLFRSLVIGLVVGALAGVQWIWVNDRLTVIYLLDQSDSIPVAKRELMLRYAIEAVEKQRNEAREDRAGLIIFGREAAIEIPPLDQDLPNLRAPEGYLGRTDATNLESALKLAQASFPEDTARRVVVITDGNETLGTAGSTAKGLADAGIGIDVIPIRLDTSAEVLLEKIDVPSQVRQGQTIDAKVVLHKYTEDGVERPVDGTLVVKRRVGNQTETLVEDTLTLDQEVTVIPIPHVVNQPAGYIYEAEFIPNGDKSDSIKQNNRATAFSYARGKGRVMLIEDIANPGHYDLLIEALRESEIEVEVRNASQLYSNLIELQSYDAVILAGVPRTSGESDTELHSFTDEHIEILVRSAQQFGTGIFMLGGPEAFGAGGWANTKLEEAMPVDFQIKNSKVEAVGALAMVMHASEIPQGNYWQKMIAKSALDVLGYNDYCGVVEYDALGDKWMWGGTKGMLTVGPNRTAMRAQISRMNPGDMPDFDPALKMALNSLIATPASTKHMIVISDGDPSPTTQGVLSGYAAAQIKVSTVAVGAHGPAGHQELQRIANATGGNYYVVTNPNALPKIFIREARRIARPLIFEPEGGVVPSIQFRHEVLRGMPDQLPVVRGFVMTQRKESPLVEVPILSPLPTETENATLLAMWTYGLGRTAVFTSDAGNRWLNPWVDWEHYGQFFSQIVRWTMRPTADEGKFQVATSYRDGRVQLIVNALDKDDKFLNFLDMSAIGVSPELKPFPIGMRQAAPGRYVGEFDATEAGSYMLSVMPGPGQAPITTGVTVPFSDEYRVRQANMSVLEQMAGLQTEGGEVGKLLPVLEEASLKELLAVDTYRSGLPPSRSLKDVWPWAVLLGTMLFLADVFVRRVAVDLRAPVRYMIKRFQGTTRADDEARVARLDRLRGEKLAVSDQLGRERGSVQFEAESDVATSSSSSAAATFQGEVKGAGKVVEGVQGGKMAAEEEAGNYTSRLLQAKRDARKKQDGK